MIGLFAAFFALVVLLLALDLGVFHRRAHEIRMREALGWSIFWIALGLAFSGVIYLIFENGWFGADLKPDEKMLASVGAEAAVRYLTGYLIEKSLSVDNLFVISVIFSALGIAPGHQHRVLFWGILGALVFRTLFIASGVWLVTHFAWTFYVFGTFLVFSGGRMLTQRDREPDPDKSWFLRAARRILPVSRSPEAASSGHFTAFEDGVRKFTPLAIALLAIELADVVFAVDSVPAILAISTDSFIVITSNVFAILGLRALYFVLANIIARFRYLDVALAFLLIIIGGKMLLHSWVKIPNLVSLAIVIGVVGLGVLASLPVKKEQ